LRTQRRLLRAIVSLFGLLTLVGAVPALLVGIVGWPLPPAACRPWTRCGPLTRCLDEHQVNGQDAQHFSSLPEPLPRSPYATALPPTGKPLRYTSTFA
jgi:hypothetical protein